MRLVLDTSAVMNAVMATEQAKIVLLQIESASFVIAPALMRVELANGLWKAAQFASLDGMLATERFAIGCDLVDQFIDDASLVQHALGLSLRWNHPVYDMLFVAACQQHGARLLTFDRKLQTVTQNIEAGLCVAIA